MRVKLRITQADALQIGFFRGLTYACVPATIIFAVQHYAVTLYLPWQWAGISACLGIASWLRQSLVIGRLVEAFKAEHGEELEAMLGDTRNEEDED